MRGRSARPLWGAGNEPRRGSAICVEKPPGDNAYVNGGFFVLNPSTIERIEGDATAWETAPVEGLARDGQLQAFRHHGFWQPVDTLRDERALLTRLGARVVGFALAPDHPDRFYSEANIGEIARRHG